MAMTFANSVFSSVEIRSFCSCKEDGFGGTESHGSAKGFDSLLLFLKADDGVGSFFLELRGVCAFEAAHVPRVFDGGDLHPQADAEKRDVILAGIGCRFDFPFDTTVAKSARNQDAMNFADYGSCSMKLDGLCLDPDDMDAGVVVCASVDEGFVDGLIGVPEVRCIFQRRRW